MKFINAKYEIWEPKECNTKNILEAIERAAKVCYKSEGNIKEGSALPFIKGIIKRGHTSVLEHGSVYFRVNITSVQKLNNTYNDIARFFDDVYMFYDITDPSDTTKCVAKTAFSENNNIYYNVYTNMRFVYEKCPKLFWDIVLERDLPDFVKLFTPEENDKYRRQTVFFTADQRITEEFIRHRIASPNKESTRYCCYSSDKHGNELTFIIPLKMKNIIRENDNVYKCFYGDVLRWKVNDKFIDSADINCLLDGFETSEKIYKTLTTVHNWRAEEARIILPLGTKADLVLTNSLVDWWNGRNEIVDNYTANEDAGEVQGKRIKGFFGLRCDNAAHPQARELAIPLMEDFERRGWKW